MNPIRCCFRPAAALLLTLGFATAQVDGRASHEPMFGPSGAVSPSGGPRLSGGAPPLIGTITTWSLTAPGFTYGFAGLSGNATVGWNPIADPTLLFLDPLALIGSIPLPLGPGATSIPLLLPPSPSLSGLDLAMQALVIDPVGNLAGSNLVVSNLGFAVGTGSSVFAFQFGPVSVPPSSWYPSNQDRSPIVENATAAAKDYTIQGTRNRGGGTLVIRDQTGRVLANIGPGQASFSVTLTVPAGGKLFFFNSDPNATVNGLTWSISVG